MKTVKGSFTITATPQPSSETLQKIGAGAMTFEKRFEGPLEASSTVSMIGMMNNDLKSGAYVALEKMTGTLEGRKGSFCLQHSSSMNRGTPAQSIHVVPDSGSDELTGLKGEMIIDIIDGKHFYSFSYAIG